MSRPIEGAVSELYIESFIAEVGNRIRQARDEKGLSRQVISDRSGVSLRYLAQLESGKGNISIRILFKVAAAIGTPPEWFITGEENANTKANRICLIGLRGAGKSSLGAFLAEELAVEFKELNGLIEQQSGIPIEEVLALYGDEGYRRLERQALGTIVKEHDQLVLAVSGGIVEERETYSYLLENFHTIWIKATPEEHMQRVRNQGDERPMAGNPQAMDDLKTILTQRETLYAKADEMVDTSGKSLKMSQSDLLEIVEQMNFPPM